MAWTKSQYHVTPPSKVKLRPQHLFYFHHLPYPPFPELKMLWQVSKYCKSTRIVSDNQQLMVDVPTQHSNVKWCLYLSANFPPPSTLSLYFKFFIPGALVTVRVLFSIMQIRLSALLILMKAALLVIGWKCCDSLLCSQEGFGGFHLIKLSALAHSMLALI